MSDISLEEVRRALTYNPETGEMHWTPEERPRRRRDLAGCVDRLGYVVIRVGGKLRGGHRLAWLLHYGKWPAHEIDHINGNRADNRIQNLRDVPHAANQRNHPARRLLVGAAPTEDGRWSSAVHKYGGAEPLGTFDTPEEANAAWLAAKQYVDRPDGERPMLRSQRLEAKRLR